MCFMVIIHIEKVKKKIGNDDEGTITETKEVERRHVNWSQSNDLEALFWVGLQSKLFPITVFVSIRIVN